MQAVAIASKDFSLALFLRRLLDSRQIIANGLTNELGTVLYAFGGSRYFVNTV